MVSTCGASIVSSSSNNTYVIYDRDGDHYIDRSEIRCRGRKEVGCSKGEFNKLANDDKFISDVLENGYKGIRMNSVIEFNGKQNDLKPGVYKKAWIQIGYNNVASESVFQLGIHNILKEGKLAGIHIGYDNHSDGTLLGLNIGANNSSNSDMVGLNLGVTNWSRGEMDGINIGVINRSELGMNNLNIGVLNFAHEMAGFNIGLYNWGEKSIKGANIALVNRSDDELQGYNIALYNKASMLGDGDWQRSGFPFNFNLSFVNRADEIAGIVNLSGVNIAKGAIVGFNLADVNWSGELLSGCNMALINYSGKDFVFASVGGINIAGRDQDGLSIGLLNWSAGLKGLDIGVLNVAYKTMVPVFVGLLIGFNGAEHPFWPGVWSHFHKEKK